MTSRISRSTREDAAPGPQYGIRAVDRALDVLDAIGDAPDGLTLRELEDRVAIPKSSVFRYVQTLESRGYLQRDAETGAYRMVGWGTGRTRRLVDAARPTLTQLRDSLGETVNLGVLSANRVNYLLILESAQSMRMSAREGDRDPLHSSALGKAIASRMPDTQVRAILRAEGMPQITLSTITDEDVYIKELDHVRTLGYAMDNGEAEEGGRCIAVPVTTGRLQAAISVSAPAFRFGAEQVEGVALSLIRCARRISDAVAADDAVGVTGRRP